jgi:hypothetical protein
MENGNDEESEMSLIPYYSGLMPAWLWVAALVTVWGWASVPLANAETLEEGVQRQTAEASGSAAADKASMNESAADIPAEVRKRIPVFYSEIRRPVRVKLDKDFRIGDLDLRPKGLF